MTRHLGTSLIISLLGVAACAGKSATTVPGVAGSWNGSFRQSQTAASSVIGPATAPKSAAYGSITLTPAEGRPGYFKVELSASAPVDPNTQLAWAIFSGPCGSPGPSVAGINEFPALEISSGGGNVRTVMGLSLDPHGSYHANVYWSSRASDVSNVMMCANLTP